MFSVISVCPGGGRGEGVPTIPFSAQHPHPEHSTVGRTSACLVSHCDQWHDKSWFQALPMPAHRYVEENRSASILTTKRSAGVTP